MANDPVTEYARKYARQKRTVALLGVLLIIVGLVLLTVLRRVPMPLRIMAGLGDIFIGCVLLVLVRQQNQSSR
ncbi:MAG TPA: hypothetical protein VHE61_24745 [Opitutaceae bacterium]|nr:hypothetical protein [Opitutaceae bacterium]